jgi:predicted DNA-binding transcriptional regulator YafY
VTSPASTKLERLLNLTAALLDTERLLPAAEIQAKVAGYAGGKAAFRRTFERDKVELRRMGIPLTVGTVPASDPPVEGYRIRPADYYLTDPQLDEDERAALHLAARAVRLEGTSVDTAFWALGGQPAVGDQGPELAVIPSDENLALLYRAISERSVVSFRYRDRSRSLEPARLQFARGHWYVGGHDRDRDEWRNFRLDRIDDLVPGDPGGFVRRSAQAADLERPPWEIGSDAVVAELEITAEMADWALAQTGEGLHYERRADGSIRLDVSVANPAALEDFVIGLLDHATLVGPADLRESLLRRLRACASPDDRAPGEPVESVVPTPRARPEGEPPQPPEPASGGSRGTLTSADRMQRLLQLIPWVASRHGVELEEITARFDYPAGELLDDLQHVVFMVGVPPYTPDALIEVEVEDGLVQINFADYFRRPLRLNPPQAVALIVAATSLLGVSTDSALERGLAKLARALGVDPAEALEVQLGAGASETLATLTEACRAHRPAMIRYYSFDRDAVTTRVIEPYRVFAHEGAWYVRGHCRSAGHERTFRLDRMTAAELTSETFAPPPGPVTAVVWDPPDDSPWVDLALEPAAHWILDYYPTTQRTWEGDRCVARFQIGGIAWLERLLLRLGPAAKVLASAGVPPDPAATAAQRILSRYGE